MPKARKTRTTSKRHHPPLHSSRVPLSVKGDDRPGDFAHTYFEQAVHALRSSSQLWDATCAPLQGAIAIARLLQVNTNEGKKLPSLEPDVLWHALNLLRMQVTFARDWNQRSCEGAHNTLMIVDPDGKSMMTTITRPSAGK